MGTRFQMPVGESYTGGEITIEGAAPTEETPVDTYGLFIGDNILNSQTTTHLVIIAIEQAMAAFKKALTNEGGQSILDRYNVRNPQDPYKQTTNDITLATEADIWIGYGGDVLDSSKSQLFVGAMEKLIAAYRTHIGVGKFTRTYAVPGGAITVATGTYASAATFDLTGEGFWQQGTKIDVAGTTDAGVFGLNAVLPRDMVLPEVSLLLAEFLKGWSLSTFRNIRHPSDSNVVTVGMLASAGGVAVQFDAFNIIPVP